MRIPGVQPGWLGVCGGMLIALASSHAAALTPATLVGTALEPRRITIQSIRSDRLTFFDAQRELRSQPLDQFLQIRDLPGAQVSEQHSAASVLELTDGQRLVGRWAGEADDGQTLIWRHERLGIVRVELERVAAFALGAALPPRQAGINDIVWLANGDQLAGFVDAVGKDFLAIQPTDDDSGKAIKLPLDRVRALRLAKPAKQLVKPMHRVWLADGSRIRVDQLVLARNELTLRAAETRITVGIPLKRVSRIDFRCPLGSIVDLTGLDMTVDAGGQVLGLPTPPRIDGEHLRLQAPVTVTFVLPDGVARFAATAKLDFHDDDARARAWTDMDLVVRADRHIVGRFHFNADHPEAAINLPIKARSLTLELDTADNGPIMDRLRLSLPVLFVENR